MSRFDAISWFLLAWHWVPFLIRDKCAINFAMSLLLLLLANTVENVGKMVCVSSDSNNEHIFQEYFNQLDVFFSISHCLLFFVISWFPHFLKLFLYIIEIRINGLFLFFVIFILNHSHINSGSYDCYYFTVNILLNLRKKKQFEVISNLWKFIKNFIYIKDISEIFYIYKDCP